MKSARRATLDDVARLAGVSLGSASRALSVPGQVKPVTLAKVQQAVGQLGYVRNGAAQALASRRTCTVAAIYPTRGNPIFAMSIHSLQQTLWAHGYQLLVASHEYKTEREIHVVRAMVERGVDAVVLVGTDHSDAVYELIRRHGLPYVLTWAQDESRQPHCVGFSYHDAAYRMAQLVVSHGHTRIALCGGVAAGNERVRARVAATSAALASAGLILRPDWVIEQPFSFEGGREAVRRILRQTQRVPDRPTALICGTDLHAIGAIDKCRARGIRVPEDLSVTGFDDIEIAALSNPPLTTVRVCPPPRSACARHAASWPCWRVKICPLRYRSRPTSWFEPACNASARRASLLAWHGRAGQGRVGQGRAACAFSPGFCLASAVTSEFASAGLTVLVPPRCHVPGRRP